MKICISPCPNDTFAFYAIANKMIDLQGFDFTFEFHDIDQLNKIALGSDFDFCKVSAAIVNRLDQATVLSSGAAIGYGNAPLLVAKKGFHKPISESIVAIPGLDTTGYALLRKFHPQIGSIRVAVFSEIMDLIDRGEVDAGVLIHEGRFVYEDHGLDLVCDFGQSWSAKYDLPIPLGCIVASQNVDFDTRQKVETFISNSVQYALNNPDEPMSFVAKHAQELSPDVQKKHIALFVNNFTVNMGPVGRDAIDAINLQISK